MERKRGARKHALTRIQRTDVTISHFGSCTLERNLFGDHAGLFKGMRGSQHLGGVGGGEGN